MFVVFFLFFCFLVICQWMELLGLLLQKTIMIYYSKGLVFQSSLNHQNLLILFLSKIGVPLKPAEKCEDDSSC